MILFTCRPLSTPNSVVSCPSWRIQGPRCGKADPLPTHQPLGKQTRRVCQSGVTAQRPGRRRAPEDWGRTLVICIMGVSAPLLPGGLCTCRVDLWAMVNTNSLRELRVMGDVKELHGYLKETRVYLGKSQRGRATGNARNVITMRQRYQKEN